MKREQKDWVLDGVRIWVNDGHLPSLVNILWPFILEWELDDLGRMNI
jgi:hypothetical protein